MTDLSADRPLLPEDPFTEDDVALVDDVLDTWWIEKTLDVWPDFGPAARLVLTALAAAGRLLPASAEHREPRKIYVAESGEYSDYSVICAFETEEDANHAHAGDSVMEMMLFPPGRLPVWTHLGWTLTYRVMPDGEGREYLPPARSTHYEWEIGTLPALMPERPKVDVKDMRGRATWDCWLVTATGRDLETVKKALADRVAQIRAEALGL